MKFIISLICGLIIFLILVGCTPEKIGNNIRMGSADAGAGVLAVSLLEFCKADKFDVTKSKSIEACDIIITLTETESLSSLPLDTVRNKLNTYLIAKGFVNGPTIVGVCLTVIAQQNIPITQNIGAENVNLIKISAEQFKINAQRCTIDGRSDWSSAAKTKVIQSNEEIFVEIK